MKQNKNHIGKYKCQKVPRQICTLSLFKHAENVLPFPRRKSINPVNLDRCISGKLFPSFSYVQKIICLYTIRRSSSKVLFASVVYFVVLR